RRTMPLKLPIIYPITSGATSPQTTPDDPQFSEILRLVRAAVDADVPLLQIREKSLHARVLFELVARAVEITHGSRTRLLVNDRVDIARAAGADGVHLTAQSLPVEVVRNTFGAGFLIGVSTHSLDEARVAQVAGADFVVFGPVFETQSKRTYGEPQGLDKLREVTRALGEFPVVAIGGITVENVDECFEAGARGVAAISMLNDTKNMASIVETIRRTRFTRFEQDEQASCT
ncbi:MAG TPA: thiamine phosphate synthase, partial [Pyrinomonadaceae bacterium]|nr:thiamine phosphate synthase [Pyrinomonadaceae bacterium]